MLKSVFLLGLLCSSITFSLSQKNAVNKNYFQDFNRAMDHIAREQFEDAQDLLEDIPEQDSLYLEAQYRLQEIYQRSENFPKVIEIGKRLSQLPYEWGHYVYFNWAIALNKMEKNEEALAVVEEGLKKYTESHLLHYVHGIVLQELKRSQEAMHAFERSVLAYPFHIFSHVKLGELALNEGRLSQALMSWTYVTLLDVDPRMKAQIHALLEQAALNDFEIEPQDLQFYDGDDFSEIDQLVRSKIALEKKFKLKTKIKGFLYIRQMQLISESLRYDSNSDGFWMQFYGKIFQSVYHSDNFENMSFVSVSGPEYGKANAAANKNEKKRDQFFQWFARNAGQNLGRQFAEFDGERQITYVEIGRHNIEARGLGSSINDRKGLWQIYDGINGRPTGTGNYENGERSGNWTHFDGTTGHLTYKVDFKNDEMNGLLTHFYPDGSTRLIVNMKDDDRDGAVFVFFPSGDTLATDFYKKGVRNGTFRRFYPNNNIQLEGSLVNDKWEGELKEYHTNGVLSAEYIFKSDEKNGAFTTYHINGQVRQKGTYKAEKLNEKFEEYHSNGQLKSKGSYKNGQLVGLWENYYFDGKLEKTFEFDENGKENGIQKRYDRDGKIHYEMEYKNGELLSYKFYDKSGKIIEENKRSGKKLTYKFYNPNGVLTIDGALENDEKNGVWTFYSDHGIKEKEQKFEKGQIVGKSKTFFPNGEINVTESYEDGMLKGLGLGYHPNGELRIEGYFRNGRRNGMWYFYYPDGTIKEKQYYVNGDIVGWSEQYAVNGLLSVKYFHEDDDISKAIYYDLAGNPIDTITRYHGVVEVPNPNGKQIKAKNTYKNDVRQDLSETFYVNNKLESTGNFVNNQKHGIWTTYYEHGTMNMHTKYVHGEIDSIRTDYRMNGNVASRTPYQNGVIHGLLKQFHPNGKLHYQVNYVDDDREGEVKMTLPTGEIYAVFYYENDVLVAYSYEDKAGKLIDKIRINKEQEITCFFKNGQQSLSAKRKNGTWHGDYIVYNPKGEIIELKQYDHDRLHGKSQFNFSPKLPYLDIEYNNGLRHGIMKIYHLNGKLFVESTYVHGRKHGEEKEYDQNGKLSYTRTYYNGDMISEKKI